jgi:serine-type D-Ala-D-Ala carboxypeptidase/endopeptidase (penicillin-binding protein 4)
MTGRLLALTAAVTVVAPLHATDGQSRRPADAGNKQGGPLAPPRPAARPDDGTPARPGEPADRTHRLRETLSSIVNGPVLGALRVGMRVVDIGSGRVLFGQHDATMMDPASNQKVLATATALLRLGGGWQFHTELTGPPPDGDGAIPGDVVLRSNGDPNLRRAHLEELAAQLVTRGVTRIDGAVLGDPRRLGADDPPAGERAPLRVSRSAIEIRIHPGERDGAAPLVSVRPASEVLVVDNRARTTGRGRGRVLVAVTVASGRIRIGVTGRMGLRHPGLVLRRVPPNQALYAAILLRATLQQAGVAVRGPAGLYAGQIHEPRRMALASGTSDTPLALEPPGRVAVLAVHDSDPLPILMRRINKDSDNEWAERLLETVGAEIYGGPATPAKGLRALREAIGEIGLPPNEYVSANASGLGHANRITAEAMADLLRRLFLDPRIGPDLLQSLSVGGIDGTTRNRFRGSPAAERVRAKTGTLRGKSCLAGYVGDGSDVLVFSIMVQGLRGSSLAGVRQAQVSAVNAMMRYVRGAVGPAPLEEAVPGVDYETGEEIGDSEGETDEDGASGDLEPAAAGPILPPPPRPMVSPPGGRAPEAPVRPARPAPKETFERAARKATRLPPPPREETFQEKVDRAFKEFERKAPKIKPATAAPRRGR